MNAREDDQVGAVALVVSIRTACDRSDVLDPEELGGADGEGWFGVPRWR